MRILLVDDDPVTQAFASGVLRPEGYEIIQAMDGFQALERYQADKPDIVLTDFEMPGMSGIELCQRLRVMAEERFVPIILFTVASRAHLLAESLDAGAIEFLTKPFEPDELRVRVRAIARMCELHDNLAKAKARSDEEMAVVKHVLGRAIEKGLKAKPPSFFMETLHTRRISGDACAYTLGLPGVHFGLLCDATGHGLMAGVSALPVLEAFNTMVTKDIPLEQVYQEINVKLFRLLPMGRFACVILFRMDTLEGTLSVLNAGIPDAYLAREGSIRTFGSRNLPAGIQPCALDDIVVEQSEIGFGDRLLAYSDGLFDLLAPKPVHEIMLADLLHLPITEHAMNLRTTLLERAKNTETHDDITWALWEVPAFEPLSTHAHSHIQKSQLKRLTESMNATYSLDPRCADIRNLLPQVLGLFQQNGLSQSNVQTLGLLLTEGLTNALDHGVLRMSSLVKQEDGFEVYDQLRRERLAALKEGWVTLSISLLKEGLTGPIRMVRVQVEDSGDGFNWRKWMEASASIHSSFGRGLTLIRAMSQDFQFNERGNRICFAVPCG